jgi:exodeoxyribonuclease V beta subunit
MLTDHAFESGMLFDKELVTDQHRLLQDLTDDYWRLCLSGASPLFLPFLLNKLSPEKLLLLLSRYGTRPIARICPAGPDRDQAEEEGRFQRALEKTAELWPVKARKVKEFLLNWDGLKRNIYAVKRVQQDIASLEALLARRSTDPEDYGSYGRYGESQLSKNVKKGHTLPENPFFRQLEELIVSAGNLAQHYKADLAEIKSGLFDYAVAELPVRKEKENIHFFDDLLLELKRALEKRGGERLSTAIRKRFPAALIDEFQDTDPVQFDIFSGIYKKDAGILFIIGDPKQAIYSFRGADIFSYLKATKNVEQGYTLEKNWRADAGLVAALNSLFSLRKNPFLIPEIVFRPAVSGSGKTRGKMTNAEKRAGQRLLFPQGQSMHIWLIHRSKGDLKPISKERARERIIRAVSGAVAGLVSGEGEGIRPGDIAVLVRKNDHARQMQAGLRRVGVPSVIQSAESLFKSEEARQLHRFLSAVHEPRRAEPLRSALVTDLFGFSARQILDLEEDGPGWLQMLATFQRYRELWLSAGIVSLARTLLGDPHVRSSLFSRPGGERRLTNYLHLVEVLSRISVEEGLEMAGTIKWLSQAMDREEEVQEEYQIRLETDDEAVRIVTIHSSKGLQYPVTFCPFLWDVTDNGKEEVAFHNDNKDLVLDLGSENLKSHREAASREELAENLRLLYVALTRARKRAYIVWGAINRAENSGLAYLLHPLDEGRQRKPWSSLKNLKDRDIRQALSALVDRSDGSIATSALPEDGLPPEPRELGRTEKLVRRRFSGKIVSGFRIASYSSLIRGIEVEQAADHDGNLLGGPQSGEEAGGIFSFPRGARAGRFFHAVFEELDFSEPKEVAPLVGEKIAAYGFGKEWVSVVSEAVNRVLSLPLDGDELVLSKIRREESLREMAFLFPARAFEASNLEKLLVEGDGTTEGLTFITTGGFVRGFVDLVFRYDDRYYLVDWKSNFLGNRLEDYHRSELSRVMADEYYNLQYHLYALALHRHLCRCLPDYEFKNNFGGVYYLFIRGIAPSRGSDFGLYRDLLSEERITAWEKTLAGGPIC